MPIIRVRPYVGRHLGENEVPSSADFAETGVYQHSDGRLFMTYDYAYSSPRNVIIVTADQARQLGMEEPTAPAQAAVDVHRLLDQILDIQGARIDGIGIRDLARRRPQGE